ncbi:hypothetical protein D3C78_880660 [compost metagenome]
MAGLTAHQLHRCRVRGFDPVGEGVAQVHQRIAQGGQFPVQHADDLHRVVRIQDHIVEAVVVVDDARRRVVGGHFVVEPGLDRLPLWRVRGQGFFITVAPALDLPGDIAFRLAQVGQAAGRVVDTVQFNQLVDEALAQRPGVARVQAQFRRQLGAQDDPLDPLHHIELGANH